MKVFTGFWLQSVVGGVAGKGDACEVQIKCWLRYDVGHLDQNVMKLIKQYEVSCTSLGKDKFESYLSDPQCRVSFKNV